MPAADSWIENKAAGTLDPSRAATALTRLSDTWPDDLPPLRALLDSFPLDPDTLLHLLAYSPVTVEKLLRDPAALHWLCEPGICDTDRLLWQMKVDLARLRDTEGGDEAPFDENFVALRRQKARELIRIALREIARTAPIEQTAAEVALLAELCISDVYEGWHRELSKRWGAPESQFCVLGMGKLGGNELNFSSDIDLIYFYSEDGQLNPNFTYQQYFTRLAEKITATFSASHEAGTLFRIDLRLRPDGNSGPLVRSLDGMEHYYAAYGETWERMALIKAKPVAGEPELGYEFLHRLQPFIYPRHLATETLQEIAALKNRIDTELVAAADHDREIKRGRGGIREIEFIVQSLQLLHAARHPFLQQPNTLKSLEALRSLDDPGLLTAEHADALATTYRSLRTLEHRIMIAEEKQTHLLPSDPEELQRLSKSLGFATLAAFEGDLHATTSRVRELFEEQFDDLPDTPAATHDLSFFTSPEAAAREIARLGGEGDAASLSPRARRVFQGLKPSFLRSLSYAAEPDLVLNRFTRFIENYGIRATLYELLIQHPRLLELLTKLFDASAYVSEIAIHRPELVEEIARAGGIDHRRDTGAYLELLAAETAADGAPALRSPTGPSKLEERERRGKGEEWDRLRRFRAAEILRIALRDVLELASLEDILLEYTALAEACLLHTLRTLDPDGSLTVIAMGKFGARELSYGSDLDVIFIGDDLEPARKLLAEFNRISEAGSLDEIDPRLRPEGRSGPLVCTLNAYETYFEKRGDLWEAQALTKARVLCGADAGATEKAIEAIWTRFGEDPDLFEKIRAMLERIYKERSGSSPALRSPATGPSKLEERSRNGEERDFKTARGGMVAIEFAVQAHQMRTGLRETNTLKAARQLAELGHIPTDTATTLIEAYIFHRRCAFVLRRLENKSVSTLPADQAAQETLARRLDYASASAFLEDSRLHRERATAAVEALLKD